jgi:LysM repeat protein
VSTEALLLAIVVVVVLAAGAALLLFRRSRRSRGRAEDREFAELEARVAQRVRGIGDATVADEDVIDARPTPTFAPLAAAPESASATTPAMPATTTAIETDTEEGVAGPPRMIPIPMPDADQIRGRDAGRAMAPPPPAPPEPSRVPTAMIADSPTPARSPAVPMESARPATAVRTTRRATPAPAERRRRRALVPVAALVVVLLVLAVAGGPTLRALVGGAATAAPSGTQLAVQPTPTATSSLETASPTPAPTPTPTATAEPTPTPSPPPGGTPFPTPQVYVVRSGDTLWQIALRFNIDLRLLEAANPHIEDPNVILPGEQVTIPTPTPQP